MARRDRAEDARGAAAETLLRVAREAGEKLTNWSKQMMVMVSMEVDDRTAEHLDAILRRYGASCASELAISDFLRGVDLEKFTRTVARDLLAERYRDYLEHRQGGRDC